MCKFSCSANAIQLSDLFGFGWIVFGLTIRRPPRFASLGSLWSVCFCTQLSCVFSCLSPFPYSLLILLSSLWSLRFPWMDFTTFNLRYLSAWHALLYAGLGLRDSNRQNAIAMITTCVYAYETLRYKWGGQRWPRRLSFRLLCSCF